MIASIDTLASKVNTHQEHFMTQTQEIESLRINLNSQANLLAQT